MNRSAPRSIDQYLRQLREELAKSMLVARPASTPEAVESGAALAAHFRPGEL